jgi:hypothetical protein
MDLTAWVVAAIAGLLSARRLFARHPDIQFDYAHKKAPSLFIVIAIAAVVALFPGIANGIYWSFPVWLRLFYLPLRFLVIIAAIAYISAFVATLAMSLRRRSVVALVAPLAPLAIVAFHWHLAAPIAGSLTNIRLANGMIVQSSGESCAAASGANILNRLGGSFTEKRMAELMNTTRNNGTSIDNIVHGLVQAGGVCQLTVRAPDTLDEVKPPAMLFVDFPGLPSEGHAVAYMGRQNGLYEIWEPHSTIKKLGKAEVLKIWHGTAVECVKQ